MKPRSLAGAAVLALLWIVGLAFVFARPQAASSVRSSEGAYRLRLCELALSTGESARRDRMLDAKGGLAVPYGPFAPGATAFVLARSLPRGSIDLEHGLIDEDRLAGGAWRLGWIVVAAGSLALAFAGARLAESDRRARPASFALAWLAASAFALFASLPSLDGGSVRAEAWAFVFVPLLLGGAALLARPRELLDQLGIAIALGMVSGLALANDPFAWPILLAPVLALWGASRDPARGAGRNALRSGLFYAASAAIVVGLRGAWPLELSPWPRFDPTWRAGDGAPPRWALDLVLAASLAWTLLAPRTHGRRILAIVLIAAVTLRAFDARFQWTPVLPAGAAFVDGVLAAFASPARGLARRAAVAVALLLLPLAGWALSRGGPSEAAVLALRGLRTRTPSSGAWNHPADAQAYALLADPRSAGVIAFHARRSVRGALLPGSAPSESSRAAEEALGSTTLEELASRARALGTPYVVAQRARSSSASGALASMLEASELPGFTRILRVPAEGGAAELAVWMLDAPPSVRPPASMRAR